MKKKFTDDQIIAICPREVKGERTLPNAPLLTRDCYPLQFCHRASITDSAG